MMTTGVFRSDVTRLVGHCHLSNPPGVPLGPRAAPVSGGGSAGHLLAASPPLTSSFCTIADDNADVLSVIDLVTETSDVFQLDDADDQNAAGNQVHQMLLTHDVAFPSTLGHLDGQHFTCTNSAGKTSRIDFVGVLVVSLDINQSRWGDTARLHHQQFWRLQIRSGRVIAVVGGPPGET